MAGPDIVRQVVLSSTASGTTLSGSVDGTGNGDGDDLMIVITGGSYSSGGGTRNISSVVYGADNAFRMRRLTAGDVAGGNENLEAWFLAAPSTGSNTLTITWGSTMDTRYARVYILSNAEQVEPNSGVGVDTSAQANLDIVTMNAVAGDLLIATAAFPEGSDPLSFNTSGYTVDANVALVSANDDFEAIIGHKVQPTTDTALDVLIDSTTSGNWACIGVAIEGTAPDSQTVNVDQASETDTALDITPSKAVDVDQAIETDTALDITPARAIPVDQAIEADTAFDITPVKVVQVDQAIETDEALTITVGGTGVPVDIAIETDTALEITPVKVVVVDQAVEVDSALEIRPGRAFPVDIALETDSAFDVQAAKVVHVDIAVETDTALPLVLPQVAPGPRKGAGSGLLAAKLLALELDLAEARKQDAPSPAKVAYLENQQRAIQEQVRLAEAKAEQDYLDEEDELMILMAIEELR